MLETLLGFFNHAHANSMCSKLSECASKSRVATNPSTEYYQIKIGRDNISLQKTSVSVNHNDICKTYFSQKNGLFSYNNKHMKNGNRTLQEHANIL